MSFFNGDILASSSDGIVLKDLGADPTNPSSGFGTIYVKNNNLHFKNNDGGSYTDTNLTSGSSGVSLSTSTDNAICTVTGSNAIQGETNLFFDGNYLYSSKTTSGRGSGFSGSSDANNYYKVYINNIGGETITHIYIDIEGLYFNGSSETIIGTSSSSNAYFYRITDSENGEVYKVELSCHEKSTESVTQEIGIFTEANGTSSTGSSASGYSSQIVNSSSLDKGSRNESTTGSSLNLEDKYLYLYSSSSGTSGTFGSGKLLIKLYGVK